MELKVCVWCTIGRNRCKHIQNPIYGIESQHPDVCIQVIYLLYQLNPIYGIESICPRQAVLDERLVVNPIYGIESLTASTLIIGTPADAANESNIWNWKIHYSIYPIRFPSSPKNPIYGIERHSSTVSSPFSPTSSESNIWNWKRAVDLSIFLPRKPYLGIQYMELKASSSPHPLFP